MTNLLYVSSGNVTRSPAAAQITLERAGDSCLNVTSAGLYAPKYMEMSDEVRIALRELGYNPREHKSEKLRRELLKTQDLVLCFEKRDVIDILKLMNGNGEKLEDKVFTLPEFAGFPEEEVKVPDKTIGRVSIFPLLKHLPKSLRLSVYKNLTGRADYRDFDGVIEVHKDICRSIERYVDGAIKRMKDEGLL